MYPIVWSATDELALGSDGTSLPVLFFVPHPAWAMRQPQDTRDKYEQDLADALTWSFTNQR
ncbi:hypothetical protein [Mycolicibacter sinensis]|uniref:Uncharacterized protein n=1 Tax=Mycolicibacter sinensis (strain JDM601) TaxID=875328 RepID=A0A1A2E2C2_MYCSD|nr:hypothetical protein [Mycolicibacter sinensis]OBF98890.1 hypothetical protein A5772_13670 [Mycolicibacter sinensis]OBG00925.1 hypothetical protein A5771_17825 [Mycolicibacter sinensis]